MTHLHGFDLVRDETIAELNTQARIWRHAQTGAELLSLENNDENKVFGVTFRTPPNDSTGIAHILEHSVLCGSRKYPLKEPFVELLKGSLKTFLNAFTYPDKTCYPVASQNLKDFYNLIDVYLDAVFYPRITAEILQQEGWHYELERAEDPLIYKGVVFNEMKGAYSSPDSLLYRVSQQSLYPDTTYGYSSGGDPKVIPDLTYSAFKEFHTTLYHPSNALVFFYGDDDPGERLRIVNEYLKDFSRSPATVSVGLQEPFSAPRRLVEPFAASADGPNRDKGMVSVNWMLGEVVDEQRDLALAILEHILLGTQAAPLRKALIDSGLGEDLTSSGLNDSLRQYMFSVGLKGINIADADKVEALIFDTLAGLARDGIDPGTLAASLNTIEFQLRENNTGSYPRGLALMIRALGPWLHGGDPLAPLAFEAALNAIKAQVDAGGRYFEQLIEQYLLNNQHRTTVVLQPDSELEARTEAEERTRLDAVRAALSDTDLQAIIAQTHELKRLQEAPDPPEALATIPSLTLADLDREIKKVPLEVERRQGATVLYHDLFTNGIVYLDLGLNLQLLPEELLPYVAVFGRALLETGTEHEDFVQLSQRIGRSTGGIGTTAMASMVQGHLSSTAWLIVRGKAIADQAGELLAILRDVLHSARLDDKERIRQIVLKMKARREAGLIPSGHQVVTGRLRARFNPADWAEEQMSGVSNLFFLRGLVEEIDSAWPAVLSRLEMVRRTLVNRDALVCNVTTDGGTWKGVAPQLDSFLNELPAAPVNLTTWTPSHHAGFEGLTIPAQVNYVGKAANLYDLGYTYHGSAGVITRYLRTSWLWDKIRVQGGAYGAMCGFNRLSGLLTFASYRDPNLLATIDIYDRAGTFLRDLQLSATDLTRAIIGAIGDMDAYQLPDAKGYSSLVRYLTGVSDEERQRIRDEVLATTTADFRAFADVLDAVRDQGQLAVLGSSAAINAANEKQPGLFDLVPVL